MMQTQPRQAPFGAWASPLSASDIAAAALGISYVSDRAGTLYWIETRPAEKGRNALMSASRGGEPVELTPPDANVRSRVHEYGGASLRRRRRRHRLRRLHGSTTAADRVADTAD